MSRVLVVADPSHDGWFGELPVYHVWINQASAGGQAGYRDSPGGIVLLDGWQTIDGAEICRDP